MKRFTAETRRRGDPLGLETVASALALATEQLAAISEDARLEAEVLLGQAMAVDRSRLLAMCEESIDAAARRAFDDLLARRLAREPLAYIVGSREFYGLEIACSPSALIPRPETEKLVSLALEEAQRRDGALSVCDVGTGTGAIAVAIAVSAPNARVVATDVSDAALALARQNVAAHGVADRVELRQADLLEDVGAFDVIVANLPYVSEAEWDTLEPEIREHEPRRALVGGKTGLELIEWLLREAPAHIAPGGVLAAEIGGAQGAAAVSVARSSFPRARITLMRDLAGWERVLVVRTEGEG